MQLPAYDGGFPLVDLDHIAQRCHPDRVGAVEGHLVEQLLAAGAEHVALGWQDTDLAIAAWTWASAEVRSVVSLAVADVLSLLSQLSTRVRRSKSR